MRRYLFEALVLSVTDISVRTLKPTFLPAAWWLIVAVVTTEILWLPRIRDKFSKFGIKGERRMWWSYPTVALVGALWLCGYWLAAQGVFSFITSRGQGAATTQDKPAQPKPEGKKPDKKEATVTREEAIAIVNGLVEDYKRAHRDEAPTFDWLNKKLEEQKRDFRITPPPVRGMTFIGGKFEGNGVAISNSDPNARFTFQGTDFINNKISIVNTPATPQDKKDKPKQ